MDINHLRPVSLCKFMNIYTVVQLTVYRFRLYHQFVYIIKHKMNVPKIILQQKKSKHILEKISSPSKSIDHITTATLSSRIQSTSQQVSLFAATSSIDNRFSNTNAGFYLCDYSLHSSHAIKPKSEEPNYQPTNKNPPNQHCAHQCLCLFVCVSRVRTCRTNE